MSFHAADDLMVIRYFKHRDNSQLAASDEALSLAFYIAGMDGMAVAKQRRRLDGESSVPDMGCIQHRARLSAHTPRREHHQMSRLLARLGESPGFVGLYQQGKPFVPIDSFEG